MGYGTKIKITIIWNPDWGPSKYKDWCNYNFTWLREFNLSTSKSVYVSAGNLDIPLHKTKVKYIKCIGPEGQVLRWKLYVADIPLELGGRNLL